VSTLDSFWPRVDKTDGCWLWKGSLSTLGYARWRLDGRQQGAHRIAYEALVGPVPEGLELDHLCRVRHCVNPAHLEPVTHRDNVLRGTSFIAENAAKTHCPQGHEYTPENTYRIPSDPTRRYCRACSRDKQIARRAARRAADRFHFIPKKYRVAS